MSDPTLAEKDPAVILADVLETHKTATGATTALAAADPRRLFLQTIISHLAQQRSLIDFSGKQGLLRYVSDEWIDELAALWGEERIPAAGSQTILTFHTSTPGPHTVPAGTRATDGSDYKWATDEDLVIGAGLSVGSVNATCTTAGSASNGVPIGQITTIVDPVAFVDQVTNALETQDGRDQETTEELRERLRYVPDIYSIAGPRDAYRALAMAAGGDDVFDVAVLSHEDHDGHAGSAPAAPGTVWLVVLPSDGSTSPSPVLEAAILAACDADTVRPLTDYVEVVDPGFAGYVPGTPTLYAINAWYCINRSDAGDAAAIQTAVTAAVAEYVTWQGSKIGRDLNPSKLTELMMAAGAKRVIVTTPTFSPLAARDVARHVTTTLTYGGIEDD